MSVGRLGADVGTCALARRRRKLEAERPVVPHWSRLEDRGDHTRELQTHGAKRELRAPMASAPCGGFSPWIRTGTLACQLTHVQNNCAVAGCLSRRRLTYLKISLSLSQKPGARHTEQAGAAGAVKPRGGRLEQETPAPPWAGQTLSERRRAFVPLVIKKGGSQNADGGEAPAVLETGPVCICMPCVLFPFDGSSDLSRLALVKRSGVA